MTTLDTLNLESVFNSEQNQYVFILSIVLIIIRLITGPSTYEALTSDTTKIAKYLFLAVKELLIGLMLGILVWLPIRGLEFAGVVFDTQRGSTTAQDYDVVFNTQTTPTAILFSQIFSGYFFASGGFLVICMILFNSISIWPPTEMLPTIDSDSISSFIVIASSVFFTALVISLPISGFLFLADITIAFVAKTAPSLNALSFGMPVKSAVLLIMLMFYMEIAFPKVTEEFQSALYNLQKVLKHE